MILVDFETWQAWKEFQRHRPLRNIQGEIRTCAQNIPANQQALRLIKEMVEYLRIEETRAVLDGRIEKPRTYQEACREIEGCLDDLIIKERNI